MWNCGCAPNFASLLDPEVEAEKPVIFGSVLWELVPVDRTYERAKSVFAAKPAWYAEGHWAMGFCWEL